MNNYETFDLTYATIDSLAEGVGSSQITPLIYRLSRHGLKINLISYEKSQPQADLEAYFKALGVLWSPQTFGKAGLVGGIGRLNKLKGLIPRTSLIHARSDIPAVAAIASQQAPVLWDVRSLWADQKVLIQKNSLNKGLYQIYRQMESMSSQGSLGMSTLTSAVVPILELRNKKVPQLRTVVPTAVDLEKFKFHNRMASPTKVLFSGTYNDYYDLHLSQLFMAEIRKLVPIEIHWARPSESSKRGLGVGEDKILSVSQAEMASVVPNYSFGVSICKLDAGQSLSAAMPTKIGEFLACGRPVVVNKGLGDMDQFIEEFEVGVILTGENNDLPNKARKLMRILSDPETPMKCRSLAEKHFNMDIGANSYLDLYSQMAKF
jgi:glycosyltransferase involved in cell wall biosynthesis